MGTLKQGLKIGQHFRINSLLFYEDITIKISNGPKAMGANTLTLLGQQTDTRFFTWVKEGHGPS
jgi:hypothetical protein